MFLGGCAISRPAAEEHLDPGTGATYARMTTKRVMFRDHSGGAAFARDYVTYAPLRVNRSGRHEHFLWLGIWSTMRDADPQGDSRDFGAITVLVDGEPMPLETAGTRPRDVHLSESPYRPPVDNAAEAYYPVTPDQLRLIYGATELEFIVSGSRRYSPWRSRSQTDDSQALAALLQASPPDSPTVIRSGAVH